jgi:hypothetical protein
VSNTLLPHYQHFDVSGIPASVEQAHELFQHDPFSEATIAELMGHTSESTTRRYTHGTEQAKRMAVEAASMRAGNSRPAYAPNGKQPALRLAVND